MSISIQTKDMHPQTMSDIRKLLKSINTDDAAAIRQSIEADAVSYVTTVHANAFVFETDGGDRFMLYTPNGFGFPPAIVRQSSIPKK